MRDIKAPSRPCANNLVHVSSPPPHPRLETIEPHSSRSAPMPTMATRRPPAVSLRSICRRCLSFAAHSFTINESTAPSSALGFAVVGSSGCRCCATTAGAGEIPGEAWVVLARDFAIPGQPSLSLNVLLHSLFTPHRKKCFRSSDIKKKKMLILWRHLTRRHHVTTWEGEYVAPSILFYHLGGFCNALAPRSPQCLQTDLTAVYINSSSQSRHTFELQQRPELNSSSQKVQLSSQINTIYSIYVLTSTYLCIINGCRILDTCLLM